MVYLVLLRGEAADVAHARQQLIASSNGWKELGPNVLLVGQPDARPESLRNFLRRQPNVEVAVMQLNGGWAAGGCDDVADWLRAAVRMF